MECKSEYISGEVYLFYRWPPLEPPPDEWPRPLKLPPPRDPPKELLLPPIAGALETRACENEGGALKTRAGAELKVLPLLSAGGLKALLRATCGAIKLFLGWLTGRLIVPGFGRVGPWTMPIEVGGAAFVILGAVETLVGAIRLWLSPTIARALDWTRGELKAWGEVAP